METDLEKMRQTTDCVRVKLRLQRGGKVITMWAKPMKQRKPGIRSFLKVNDQGECPSRYNSKKNTVTETKHFFVVTEASIIEEKPAFMSLKYGELEVDDGSGLSE